MNASRANSSPRSLIAMSAAIVMVVSFFLPWVTWGSLSSSLADSFSKEMNTGQGWLVYGLLVGGAVLSVCASGARVLGNATGRQSAVWALAGFACALAGFAFFLIDWSNYAGVLAYSGYAVGIGVWLGLVASLVGLVSMIADVSSPGYRPIPDMNNWAGASAPAQAWPAAPVPTRPNPATFPGASGAGARLTYVESGRPTTLVVSPGEQVIVGRESTARVRLSDPRVSRQHAMILRIGNDWVVRDLGATNPTRLLGSGGTSQPVQGEVRFASGQLLVGEVLLTLFPTGA
jgi:hypothetical protein